MKKINVLKKPMQMPGKTSCCHTTINRSKLLSYVKNQTKKREFQVNVLLCSKTQEL
jgi:hypothetical protein